jgi:ferredoxin
MPKITINAETVDAAAGDNLLALARRNAAHIWFVCDGRGLCQTCECRVLSGAEHLSNPSKIELESMTDSRRERGCRLACQTRVNGPGSVSLISVAEELRKQAAALIEGQEGTTLIGNAGQLAGKLARVALDFTRSLPAVAINAVPQIISMPPDISGIKRYIRDSWKVTERLLRNG